MDQMNRKLTVDDFMSLEKYNLERPIVRKKMMAHKKNRILHIGPNATLHFEDRLTMQYQIQEIIKAEQLCHREAIEEELEVYNALVPDGNNWKATFMIEYADVDERKHALCQMVGIENQISVQVDDCKPVIGIADEDLERTTDDKTSSVHFMRFQFDDLTMKAIKGCQKVLVSIMHQFYLQKVAIPNNILKSLLNDLN